MSDWINDDLGDYATGDVQTQMQHSFIYEYHNSRVYCHQTGLYLLHEKTEN